MSQLSSNHVSCTYQQWGTEPDTVFWGETTLSTALSKPSRARGRMPWKYKSKESFDFCDQKLNLVAMIGF